MWHTVVGLLTIEGSNRNFACNPRPGGSSSELVRPAKIGSIRLGGSGGMLSRETFKLNLSKMNIDTNYYKQNKQNDDFELNVTKDHFYKAYGTLPTKTPTDFEQYVTAA